jgi:hypothetical protein
MLTETQIIMSYDPPLLVDKYGFIIATPNSPIKSQQHLGTLGSRQPDLLVRGGQCWPAAGRRRARTGRRLPAARPQQRWRHRPAQPAAPHAELLLLLPGHRLPGLWRQPLLCQLRAHEASLQPTSHLSTARPPLCCAA